MPCARVPAPARPSCVGQRRQLGRAIRPKARSAPQSLVKAERWSSSPSKSPEPITLPPRRQLAADRRRRSAPGFTV
jgi:hypothetical protein